jgi:hypothetical protein
MQNGIEISRHPSKDHGKFQDDERAGYMEYWDLDYSYLSLLVFLDSSDSLQSPVNHPQLYFLECWNTP